MGSGASIEVFGDGELEAALAKTKASARWTSWEVFRSGYDSIVNAIVRPPRHKYDEADLGPAQFHFDAMPCWRRDFAVRNDAGAVLQCSVWDTVPGAAHCVVYIHSMSGSRVEALSHMAPVLQRGMAFAAFDCAGSGLSDGQYITLGLNESRDLLACVRALHRYNSGQFTSVSFWGHCMGANAAMLLCNATHLNRTVLQRSLAVEELQVSVLCIATFDSLIVEQAIPPRGDETGIEAGSVLLSINGTSVTAMGTAEALKRLHTEAFAVVEVTELEETPQPCASPSFVTWLVLDSGFTDLSSVMTDMAKSAQRNGLFLPGFLASAAMALLRSSVKKKAAYEPTAVAPHAAIEMCTLPVLFVHATDDDFVEPHHSEANFNACGSAVKHYVTIAGTHETRRSPTILEHVWPIVDQLQGIESDQVVASGFAPWASFPSAHQWTFDDDLDANDIAAFSAYASGYKLDTGTQVQYQIHVFAPRGTYIRAANDGSFEKMSAARRSSETKEDNPELKKFWETTFGKGLAWSKSWRRASTGSLYTEEIAVAPRTKPNDFNADGDLDFVVERGCRDIKLLLGKLIEVDGSLHTPLQRIRSRLAYSTKLGAARLEERQELLNEALQVVSTNAVLVDWSLVPTNASTARTQTPVGCTCKQPAPVVGACYMFDCTCPCDVTAGVCDAYCCCDTECPATHVDAIAAQGLCIPVAAAYSIPFCDASVVTVNRKYGILDAQTRADGAMCVYVENNEVSGTYYSPPKTAAVAPDFAGTSTRPSYAQAMQSVTQPVASATYREGDLIKAFVNDSEGVLSPNFGGHLMLPTTSLSTSQCFPINPVEYTVGLGAQATSCSLPLTNVAATCTTLGMTAYVQSLLVAATPRSMTLVPVTLRQATMMTISGAVDVTATAGDAPTFTVVNQMCNGVLFELDYVVHTDGNGTVLGVQAEAVVGAISASARSLHRRFSVSFASTSDVTRTQANANLIDYPRSGNPGYVDRLPLRGGVLTTNNTVQVVAEEPGGVHLFATGACTGAETTGVRFNEDTLVSCSLELNLTQFQTFCMASAVASVLTPTFTHVAAFGNADPFKVTDWVAVDAPTNATSSGLYSGAQCTNVVKTTGKIYPSSLVQITGANIMVSYTDTGAVSNPQRKITSVVVEYMKDTLQFLNPAATQVVLLSVALTFRSVPATTPSDLILPAPEIWFTIPSDVFYPFLLSSAPPSTLSGVWALVLLTVLSS
ncbi:hypothetical protein ACHHYP_13624 [Achlya hypogyna]|uniref:Uncharacterized protein n=1 Tax=Achlya hypogyna TaxID=1202772 RepID=A0A1V9ZFK1_ACHHY|nr:hypothetical protein ACHHYP_13624 [Achlya hypogyna]